jgi:signal transduction histidine kinase
MEIDFSSNASNPVPLEIGITLLRVLQEALQNAKKYSGVKHVKVRLTRHGNQVHLLVSDSGKGFDVEGALQGKGLRLPACSPGEGHADYRIKIEAGNDPPRFCAA